MRRSEADAEYLLDYFGVSYPPVNVFAMAVRLGVEMHNVVGLGDVGTLSTFPRRAELKLSKEHPIAARRVAAATGIGHLMLHHPVRSPFGAIWNLGTAGPENHAATRFAGNLLVPEWMAMAYIDENDAAMARQFGVPTYFLVWCLRRAGLR